MSMPFAEPFGLAWLGYILYGVLILIAIYALLWAFPLVIIIWNVVSFLFMIPINLFTMLLGKKRTTTLNSPLRKRND